MADETIAIVIDIDEMADASETAPPQNVRGWGQEAQGREAAVRASTTRLSVADLEARMSGFLQVVTRIFRSAEHEAKKTEGMSLDEIELSVEIGAEGEIRLIGSGAKASGKGAIKLKFKRQQVTA